MLGRYFESGQPLWLFDKTSCYKPVRFKKEVIRHHRLTAFPPANNSYMTHLQGIQAGSLRKTEGRPPR